MGSISLDARALSYPLAVLTHIGQFGFLRAIFGWFVQLRMRLVPATGVGQSAGQAVRHGRLADKERAAWVDPGRMLFESCLQVLDAGVLRIFLRSCFVLLLFREGGSREGAMPSFALVW